MKRIANTLRHSLASKLNKRLNKDQQNNFFSDNLNLNKHKQFK